MVSFSLCAKATTNHVASYIVDLEDYGVIEGAVPKKVWTDAEYEFWGLAEECRGK